MYYNTPYQPKPNKGTLFPRRKMKQSSPDMGGDITIGGDVLQYIMGHAQNGAQEVKLSIIGYNRQGNNGPLLSLTVMPFNPPPAAGTAQSYGYNRAGPSYVQGAGGNYDQQQAPPRQQYQPQGQPQGYQRPQSYDQARGGGMAQGPQTQYRTDRQVAYQGNENPPAPRPELDDNFPVQRPGVRPELDDDVPFSPEFR